MRSKPKLVQDIVTSKNNIWKRKEERINLGYKPELRGKKYALEGIKGVFVAVASWILILGTVAAPTLPTYAATPQEEREELQRQLRDLEAQIDQHENQISSYRKQGKTLSNEIGALNSKISKLNLQIRAIQLTLVELNKKIGETQEKIVVIEKDIDTNKATLGELLRNLRSAEDTSLVEIFLKSDNFSEFFNDVNNMTVLQDTLRGTIEQITTLRNQLQDQSEQLKLARADAATIKLAQESQKQETESVKSEKNSLLQVTKGQEAKYQQLVAQNKAKAAQIRSRLFQLLGGGQMTFEQAYQYAKFAQNATGVRAALTLAVLDRESALGRNVGRCSYRTAMSPTRDIPAFLEITRSLGIDPEKQMVSCANQDGVYGGAMGPAQFIPSTWKMYASRISAITGRSPANPWTNSDAFVASALYLKDAGAATNEKVAAAKYYCGGNWNRYVCLEVYGRAVVNRAASFQQDINLLNQQ